MVKISLFKNIFREKICSERGFNNIALIIAVFLIPVSLLFFFQSAFFSETPWIDPFIYIGYGHNYFDQSFLGHYYKISRLPYVLVQVAFRSLFNSEIAGYVMHFTIYTLSSYLIFTISRKISNILPGLLIAMVTPLLLILYSGRPDYHNNFSAITFLSLILYVITFCDKRGGGEKKELFIAGALYAIVVYCNILLSFDALIYSLVFYFCIRTKNNLPIIDKISNKILFVFAGFLFCTLTLCLINYSTGRQFLFMKPLWSFILGSNPGDNESYWKPFSSFIKTTEHLSYFFAMFLYSIFITAYLLFKKSYKKELLVFLINIAFILVFIEMILTQLMGINNINLDYFAFSGLVPFLITLLVNWGFVFKGFNLIENSIKNIIFILSLSFSLLLFLFYGSDIDSLIYYDNYGSFYYFFVLWFIFFITMFLVRNNIDYIKAWSASIIFLLIISAFLSRFSIHYDVNHHEDFAKDTTDSYVEFNKEVKKYKLDFDRNSNGNIFGWWNASQNLQCGDKLNSENVECSQVQLTSLSRSLIAASSGSIYPLDDVWISSGINEIDNLWKVDGEKESWFKKYFLEYKSHPKVIVMITYDENDVIKMIKKMKSYNMNFTVSEKLKIITDKFVIQYFILTEDGHEK